jgi:hypothetical protein
MRSSADIVPKRPGISRAALIEIKVVSRCRVSAWILKVSIRSIPMMDIVMVALAVGFFAVSIAYVYACEL